jgi:RNA polymerase sigma-70 factor (ECF subfamily)
MGVDTKVSSDSSSSIHSTLLRAVRQHDPEAWERLVHLFSPLIYDWCRQQSLQASDAADVMQEVFRAVMKGVDTFRRRRPGDSFRGWLWKITRNKVRDHYRDRAARPTAFGGADAVRRLEMVPDEEPSSSAADSGSGASYSLYQRALELLREHFEERTWTAFWRVAIERDSTADVAADLGMTTGAVRKAKARVLRRLREEFGELLD